ncbi:DUF932 domain-containing protein [Stenotrophomonas sp. SRS1]|uniref:DUF932 domain-containing protein n=1 Tax=Stenotrophomonas sp. SRS1 TaxID=2870345 RepID=UPI00223841BB|nr:DUF932 domain-containing protein [Stenotrophomonas sp. SRS1]MCW6026826.1 DUF932 domain-containing protein [Stenotrophomonas sp. SRS1]
MHLVETTAYTGQTPWHGLGNKLSKQQSIEVWKRSAGMDWSIEESEVQFATEESGLHSFPENKVLFRSDTRAPLAVVSKRFQVVQPGEILEFYRDLTQESGFELETAGVLRQGRKFWALARTGQSVALRGRDRVNGYLLLATACDGTLATTAQLTSIRVVCNNTLAISLRHGEGAIKVPHRSQFDPAVVKRQLGITVSAWGEFSNRIKVLSECRVDPDSAEGLLRRVLTYTSQGANPVVNERAVSNVRSLFQGAGRGAQFDSSQGTAWGLLNGITEYVDHHRRAYSRDHRMDAAWFGQGARLKERAWKEVWGLVA